MTEKKPQSGQEQKRVTIVRTVLFLLALICMVHGIMNGSMTDVLNKAIRICTECIGLG